MQSRIFEEGGGQLAGRRSTDVALQTPRPVHTAGPSQLSRTGMHGGRLPRHDHHEDRVNNPKASFGVMLTPENRRDRRKAELGTPNRQLTEGPEQRVQKGAPRRGGRRLKETTGTAYEECAREHFSRRHPGGHHPLGRRPRRSSSLEDLVVGACARVASSEGATITSPVSQESRAAAGHRKSRLPRESFEPTSWSADRHVSGDCGPGLPVLFRRSAAASPWPSPPRRASSARPK